MAFRESSPVSLHLFHQSSTYHHTSRGSLSTRGVVYSLNSQKGKESSSTANRCFFVRVEPRSSSQPNNNGGWPRKSTVSVLLLLLLGTRSSRNNGDPSLFQSPYHLFLTTAKQNAKSTTTGSTTTPKALHPQRYKRAYTNPPTHTTQTYS